MLCEDAQYMMSARLDGELPEAEMEGLDAHLRACRTCESQWQRFRALDSLLREIPMERSPNRVRIGVMQRLERSQKAHQALLGGTALTLGTLALAGILLAPLLMGLLEATGVAPALFSGGLTTIEQLIGVGETLGRAFFTLLEQLVLPLAFLSLCGLILAVAFNRLWVKAVQRVS